MATTRLNTLTGEWEEVRDEEPALTGKLTLNTRTNLWENERGEICESFRSTPVPKDMWEDGWRSAN